MPGPLISVQSLQKTYLSGGQRITALGSLSFDLSPGESLSLVGRSGSGKSTLLNILCGLQSADRGELQVLGHRFPGSQSEDTESLWAGLRRQRLGVVFQDANLMPALTLLESIQLRCHLANTPADQAQTWLDKLGIGELGNRYPDQVSGGQRQRAAIAMVFAMAPDVILADEPTGSLDKHTADAVADLLLGMQQERGCALVLATHDLALAERCDQLIDLGSAG